MGAQESGGMPPVGNRVFKKKLRDEQKAACEARGHCCLKKHKSVESIAEAAGFGAVGEGLIDAAN